jgi:putative ABC transport system permease protein
VTIHDLAAEAIGAIGAHRLRTSLSSLGVVVGVATVIVGLAIGDGARRQALAETEVLGANNVYVQAEAPAERTDPRLPRPAPILRTDDADALAVALAGLDGVVAVRAAVATVTGSRAEAQADVLGVTPGWRESAGVRIARGRWLQRADVAGRARVAVLSPALANRLFDGDPLGRHLLVAGAWYRVVGVLESGGPERRDPVQQLDTHARVLVPLPAMDVRLGEGDADTRLSEIALRVTSAADVTAAARAAEALLARRHPDGGWRLLVPRALLAARLRARRTFDAVLLAIGGLALAISGIGIMNIMLANVAERTHEIGVRRAFGATARTIVAQFALEAALLCAGGGALGVPLGAAVAAAIAALGGWPIAIAPASIALALALAAAVGLLFGIYPARLAARLDPAVALRAE